MIRKKNIILGTTIACLWLSLNCQLATAQNSIQTGVVKTRGKMENGQLVPGHGLKGAIVVVKNRTPILVDSDKGTFSFPIRSEQFYVESVTKKGYQLVDAEVCKTYQYSKNPICFVMDTPEQQLEDQIATERRIRRTLQKQLQEKENEIDSLKEYERITQEEYHQALQQLYAAQENNEQLIKDMAAQYSKIDYDQIDEFYRQVSCYILDGELTKADSLLRSRGDVSSQAKEKMHQKQLLYNKKEELKKAKSVLDAEIDELARRCYSYYETFLMKHQNDSAAYYIELRANLDTTNVEWQNSAAICYLGYIADYDKAEALLLRSLRQARHVYKDSSMVVVVYNTLSEIEIGRGNFKSAMNILLKAKDIQETLLKDNKTDLANTYNNIGLVYFYLNDYSLAIKYHRKAHKIREQYYGKKHHEVALSYHNLGAAYSAIGDYKNALKNLQMGLAIREELLGDNDPYVAQSCVEIGCLYDNMRNYDVALSYFQRALTIWRDNLGENHPDLATAYNNMANIYTSRGDFQKAQNYLQNALSLLENTVGRKHPYVAAVYDNLGRICFYKRDYSTALDYFHNALSIQQEVYGDTHLDIASTYNFLAGTYSNLGEADKAIEYYHKALSIQKSIYGDNHENVSFIYICLGIITAKQKDYQKALEYYKKALKVQEHLDKDHPNNAFLNTSLGALYRDQGEYPKALDYYFKALSFLEQNQDDEPYDLADNYKQIAWIYYSQKDYQKSLEYNLKVLDIYKKLFGSDHQRTVEVNDNIEKLKILIKNQEGDN